MQFRPDFEDFLNGWRSKAGKIDCQSLAGMYDKFFTLFVIHNRLYAMATFCLWSEGKDKPPRGDYFPDSKAASKNLALFLDPASFLDAIQSDPLAQEAFQTLKDHIRSGHYYFKLKRPYSKPDQEADKVLLRMMESRDTFDRASAPLDLLYCLRCNMFHGSKNFSSVQEKVIRPATKLLEKVIELTEKGLKSREEPVEKF